MSNLPVPTGHVDQAGQVVPFVPRSKTPAEAAAEFFAAQISNANTRAAYTRDALRFGD